MKKYYVTILLLIAALGVSACADPRESEQKKLQGRWNLAQEFYQGKDITTDDAKKTFLIFEGGDAWRVEFEGQVVARGTFKLDPNSNPKTIDYTASEGEDKGKNFLAIYELTGDSFKHCGERDAARPQTFESKPGTEIFLTVFTRVK